MAEKSGFAIFGIPVRIQPVFFVVIVFLGLFSPAPIYIVTWVLIATFSILLHEFGHAIAFRSYGLKPSVTLHAMGGLTSARASSQAPPFTPGRSIVTSLAGPFSALFLLGLPALWYCQQHGFDPWLELRPNRGQMLLSAPEIILAQVVYINVGWSLLNLLPVLPLDGGNVTASVAELIVPSRGRRIAAVLSIVFAVVVGVWGFSAGYIVAPVFALMFIGMSVNELTRGRHDDADDDLGDAVRALVQYEPAKAEELARSVMLRNPRPEAMGWAIELSAWARLATGDLAGAHHLLVAMPAGSAPSASIRGALALASGRTLEGVTTLAWAFAHDPSKSAKLLGAMAAAQTGQVAAVGQELVRMGPQGVEGTRLLASLLDYLGYKREAAEVTDLAAYAAPRPPGW